MSLKEFGPDTLPVADNQKWLHELYGGCGVGQAYMPIIIWPGGLEDLSFLEGIDFVVGRRRRSNAYKWYISEAIGNNVEVGTTYQLYEHLWEMILDPCIDHNYLRNQSNREAKEARRVITENGLFDQYLVLFYAATYGPDASIRYGALYFTAKDMSPGNSWIEMRNFMRESQYAPRLYTSSGPTKRI